MAIASDIVSRLLEDRPEHVLGDIIHKFYDKFGTWTKRDRYNNLVPELPPEKERELEAIKAAFNAADDNEKLRLWVQYRRQLDPLS